MKNFRRRLSRKFVCTLVSNPFWNNICSDRQLQPEIRNNVVTVYSYGGALLRELHLRKGNLSATVHHKFVPLQKSRRSVYLPMTWKDDTGFRFRDKLQSQVLGDGNAEVLKAYKRLMRLEAGPEDLLQQRIVLKVKNSILDQEVKFPGKVHNRIDICCYDPSIKQIVFVEVKRIDDSRLLRPEEQPEVIKQLGAYKAWLRRDRRSILSAYTEVIRLKRELGLDNRLKGVPTEGLKLETKPLLVIGNCTDQDVREIRNAFNNVGSSGPWARLWRHLEEVSCGVIICGKNGCQLSIGHSDGQRWQFSE